MVWGYDASEQNRVGLKVCEFYERFCRGRMLVIPERFVAAESDL
jgi:hypothetical protein